MAEASGTNAGSNIDAKELSGEGAGAAGGGGATSSKSPGAPVEVEIGGKKFAMPPDVAAAVIALKATNDSTLAEAREMIASLKPRSTGASGGGEGANADATFYKAMEQEIFTDPAGAVKKIVDRAVGIAETRLTRAYEVTRGQEEFWVNFYEKHPDLKAHREYVTFVMTRDFEALKALPTTQAINKISETVKADILKLRGNTGGGNQGRAAAEGGTEAGAGQSNAGSEHSLTDRKGLTGVLKERAEARRKAARGGA